MLEKAKWIYNPCCNPQTAPVFKKTFTLGAFSTAKIAVCGVGFYVLLVNGERVSDELLTPPFTAYDKKLLYQVYDLSDRLVVGENTVEITCGNGWFNELESTSWDFDHAAWKATPRAICEIEVDGKTALVTDSSWQTAESKTVFNSLRCGETYDARKEIKDYESACIARAPGGILLPQEMPPVRLKGLYEGKEIFPHVFDFGRSIAGNVELRVRGKKGRVLELQYSERLRDDYTPDNDAIRASSHVMSNRFACDTYILKGEGEEVWHGNFSFQGFRYVTIEWLPADVEIISLTARDMHTDLQEIGGYVCDNPRINQLHAAVLRSTLTNYMHIPTDCPHREKNGWTADAMLSSYQTLYNFDMKAAYLKWLDDLVDTQRPNGAVSCIAPTSVWGYQWGSGITWDVPLFVMPWNIYLFTGDKDVLARYREPMRKYLSFLDTQADDDIFTIGLGDWCAPVATPVIDTRAILTCYAKKAYDIYAAVSAIFGDAQEEARAKKRSAEIRAAFQKEFVGKHHDAQTYYAALVYFDFVDDKQAAADKLARVVQAADGRINAGIFGALIVPEVLRDYGYFDLAWEMITKEGYPSWFYMLDKCSGTLAEYWECSKSLDHHMFSTVDAFIHGSLSGLRTSEASAGFERVCLKPYFPKGMNEFSAHYTIRGEKLEISWDKDAYRVLLPENIEATAEIGGKTYRLKAGENRIDL